MKQLLLVLSTASGSKDKWEAVVYDWCAVGEAQVCLAGRPLPPLVYE